MTEIPLKKKLTWQCRRGMLELDVVLIPFLEKHFDTLESDLQAVFSDLLKEADPDLYTWIMGYGKSENESFNQMITIIRDRIGITS